MNILKRIIFALLLSLIISFGFSFLFYRIAIFFSPPEFHDSLTGETHPVMPIGQSICTLIGTFLIFILSFIILYRKHPLILKKLKSKAG